MFALIDMDNSYVGIEQIFQPGLRNRPVVVASSNDGCVVARSDEARALGIKMGVPLFQIRSLMEHHGVIALSSNYELYGSISDRFMTIAAGLSPACERYSIDEIFCGDLQGVRDVTARSWAMRERIKTWLSIQSTIGIGPTKTIAKLMSRAAKNAVRKPGSYPIELAHVCNWNDLTPALRESILATTMATDVWGIGRRIGSQLAERGIITALDVARMSANVARTEWSVVLERTVRELQGISCIPLELAPPPKRQIACTRSFGYAVTDLEPLVQAVSEFATRACEKLRAGGLRAGAVNVFIHTSPFRPGKRFYRNAMVQLHPSSSDTKLIVNAALRGLKSIYEPGFQLAKAGVLLVDLSPQTTEQQGLLEELCPDHQRDQSPLMEAMDALNHRYGKGTVQVASTGIKQSANADWRAKQERRTLRYTTRWDEIPIVRA